MSRSDVQDMEVDPDLDGAVEDYLMTLERNNRVRERLTRTRLPPARQEALMAARETRERLKQTSSGVSKHRRMVLLEEIRNRATSRLRQYCDYDSTPQIRPPSDDQMISRVATGTGKVRAVREELR